MKKYDLLKIFHLKRNMVEWISSTHSHYQYSWVNSSKNFLFISILFSFKKVAWVSFLNAVILRLFETSLKTFFRLLVFTVRVFPTFQRLQLDLKFLIETNAKIFGQISFRPWFRRHYQMIPSQISIKSIFFAHNRTKIVHY